MDSQLHIDRKKTRNIYAKDRNLNNVIKIEWKYKKKIEKTLMNKMLICLPSLSGFGCFSKGRVRSLCFENKNGFIRFLYRI